MVVSKIGNIPSKMKIKLSTGQRRKMDFFLSQILNRVTNNMKGNI